MILYLVIGRHRYETKKRQEEERKGQKTITTNVQVVTTMSMPTNEISKVQSSSLTISGSKSKALENFQEFKEGMDIKVWLIKLELYMEQVEQEEWTKITLEKLDASCFTKLEEPNHYQEASGGYNLLKDDLMQKFAVSQSSPSNLAVEIYEVRLFRNQVAQESVEDYGQALRRAAKESFPKSHPSDLDKIMQETFANGLFHAEVRQPTKKKMLKMRNQQEKKFDIEDLIKYASCTFFSLDSTELKEGPEVICEIQTQTNEEQPAKVENETQKPQSANQQNQQQRSNNCFQNSNSKGQNQNKGNWTQNNSKYYNQNKNKTYQKPASQESNTPRMEEKLKQKPQDNGKANIEQKSNEINQVNEQANAQTAIRGKAILNNRVGSNYC
jgi:hypothetical protein